MGWIAGGVGIVGFATSAVFYAMRASDMSDLDAVCGRDRQNCPASARDQYDAGKRDTLIANIGLGVGFAGVVGAAVLLLVGSDSSSPRTEPAKTTLRVMPAKCVVRLPDAISFETGAAMMLKGLTAQYLLKKTLPQGGLQPGDFVLFHAAAGGVGLIACQWAARGM